MTVSGNIVGTVDKGSQPNVLVLTDLLTVEIAYLLNSCTIGPHSVCDDDTRAALSLHRFLQNS